MTQLCAIPGCRLRHRHLPTCAESDECSGCLPRLADDGYSCPRCASVAAQNLESVAEVALAVSDAANRLSSGSDGGDTGKPGSRLPFDLAARSRLDAVEASLYGWARRVAEERGMGLPGLPVPPKPPSGPVCRTRYECTHDSCRAIRDPASPPLLLAVVAGWLAGHLDWLAHRPEVGEAFADFAACARALRGVARGPQESRYLGPCGAISLDDITAVDPERGEGIRTYIQRECEGDVYARDGASTGRCRTCGAEVSTAERQAWLDAEVRSRAFTAKDIADAYGINVKTIRSWATERQARYDHSGTLVQAPRPAKLRSYWRTEAGLTVEWADPVLDPKLKGDALEARLGEISDEIQARGGRLHYVGDVLDLAAADAARRETARNDRERRKAVRESEGAAA